ncbi:MAG: helix-turn-helix domain-containing protein [Nitrospinota bacterium]
MSMAFFEKKDNNVYMGIGSEIRRLRRGQGMSQAELARRASVEVRHISRLENERHSPTADVLTRIAGALGVLPGDLWPAPRADGAYKADGTLKADGERPAPPPPKTSEGGAVYTAEPEAPAPEGWIPIVGNVSGGESENLWGDGDFPAGSGFDQLQRPPDLFDANAFALEVRGDSMAPVFRNGALVVVSPNREVNSGDFAVVRTREGKSYFKIVWIEADQVRLTSISPAEPPMVFRKRDVKWIYPVVWAKLRR